MSDPLEQALRPVQSFFRGKKISENTVLAAYMRAAGIPPNGPRWRDARKAYKEGASFEQAVRAIGGVLPNAINTTSSRQSASLPNQANAGISSNAGSGNTSNKAEAFADPPSQLNPGRERLKGSDARKSVSSHAADLSWFPKPFTQGDIHGQGVEKLLGRPDLEQMEVLVRETAQNSWDARGLSTSIDFRINLRRLPPDVLTTLRNAVFRETGGGLGLKRLLEREEVWALEISDRGTVGLAGPTRTDLEPAPDVPTNFIDFVFDLGAPKKERLSGGTYGYGKTISYSTSTVGTILIWSRTRNGGELEDRLIGSAIGPSFSTDGKRYTGRHWWGAIVSSGQRVEPLTGANATEIAQRVFAERMEGSTTGTSILILDPDFGDGELTREGQASMLAEFVENHLWPKMVHSPHISARMNIGVELNGSPVPIGDSDSNRLRDIYAACLNEIRQAQAGEEQDSDSLLHLVPIHRYKDTIGHLCLTRFPTDFGAPSSTSDDEMSPRRLFENRIALMRHEAELVVKYLDFPALPIEGFGWVGVFKPVLRTDGAFAAAEPPAHDEWNPATVPDKIQKSIVNVALRRIREAVASYLAPSTQQTPQSSSPPAAKIGDFLSGLLVGLPGSAPRKTASSGRPSSPRKSKARAQVVDLRTEGLQGGEWNRSVVSVKLVSDDTNEHLVAVDLSIATEAGSGEQVSSGVVRNAGWITERGMLDEPLHSMRNNERAFYTFEFHSQVAIDIRLRVENDL